MGCPREALGVIAAPRGSMKGMNHTTTLRDSGLNLLQEVDDISEASEIWQVAAAGVERRPDDRAPWLLSAGQSSPA